MTIFFHKFANFQLVKDLPLPNRLDNQYKLYVFTKYPFF